MSKPTIGSERFRVWLAESQVRAEIANKLGVTPAALSAWTRGLYTPRQRYLLLIQELAGIPRAEWFLAATAPASTSSTPKEDVTAARGPREPTP